MKLTIRNSSFFIIIPIAFVSVDSNSSISNLPELDTCLYELFTRDDRYYHSQKILHFVLNHPVYVTENNRVCIA